MSRIGTRVPLHSSSVGKAWLATLDPEALQAVLDRLPLPARTRHTVTDRTALERQLQATRERGYSLDIQENERRKVQRVRKFDTLPGAIQVRDVIIGAGKPVFFVGPCSVESMEQMVEGTIALCDCAETLTGRIAVSLDLIDELGLTVHNLDGTPAKA